MLDAFSPDVVNAVKAADNIAAELVPRFLELYIEKQPTIEGAPTPACATVVDAVGIARVGIYSAAVDKNWQGFMARINAVNRTEQRAFNPYLPRWDGKTEDRLFPWADHTGPVNANCRMLLDKAFEDAAPSTFGAAPTADTIALNEVIDAMGTVLSRFLVPMGDGEKNPDWAWGPALCTAAGLGLTGARRLMSFMQSSDMLTHWAACPDEELIEAIKECQLTSGYPISLLRVQWSRLRAALYHDDWSSDTGAPRFVGWLRAAILLHWFKHTRLSVRNGEVTLVAAYRGSYIRRTLDPEALDTGWFDRQNAGAIHDICSKLDLPISSGRDAAFLDMTVRAVLADIRPSMTIRCRAVHTRPHYIPGPTVAVIEHLSDRYGYQWVDPGIGVRNVATLNMATGAIDSFTPVTGIDALALDWEQQAVTPEDILNWRASLPTRVDPVRPSEFISKYLRNRADLGHKEAADAIIDAVMVADLFRGNLAGSPVGMALQNEFPPIFFLPTGHTQDTTTNQGKTLMARIIGKVFVPNLEVVQFSESTSAPAQRSVADPIYRYGTALYDEFILPEDNGHFLNKQGIQSLATGGRAGPGQAGENGPPPRLSHPMLFATKLAAFPEDIYNRMVAIFLDKLTEETRSKDEELGAITSGRASIEMRLSCIRWVLSIGLLDYLAQQQLVDGAVWRFNAHLTIAQAFCTRDKIAGYFAAARDQCRSQLEKADESGLTADLNIRQSFDPGYYLENIDMFELSGLAEISKGAEKGKPLSNLEFTRKAVENGGLRKFDAEIRKFKIGEKAAVQKFSNFLRSDKNKPYHGFEIKAITAAESKIVDQSNRPRAYITIKKL